VLFEAWQSTTALDISAISAMQEEPSAETFEAAVALINGAISSGGALETAAAQRKQTVLDMQHYLSPARLNLDISQLRLVHVTGTKGKGSTCCLAEAVLRKHGLRTGLFTSPHLLKITERIRINGAPVSESTFAKYTFEVATRLQETSAAASGTPHPPMPTFFRLLTLIGLWTFVHEK
jgi:folylpolyglutamate synthase